VRVMGCMGRDLGFFGMVWAVLVMAARCAPRQQQGAVTRAVPRLE
jgi:hypothetical protein